MPLQEQGASSTLRPGIDASWGTLNEFLGCKNSQEHPVSLALGKTTQRGAAGEPVCIEEYI